jgi:hypothetical protein
MERFTIGRLAKEAGVNIETAATMSGEDCCQNQDGRLLDIDSTRTRVFAGFDLSGMPRSLGFL